jgi:hypothetical protein
MATQMLKTDADLWPGIGVLDDGPEILIWL